MARPSLRPDEIESFRERLCDAAMQTFAEQGYDAVTLRALAEKLGCSHATPYRYFADKREIFAAVCALGFDRFADALERAARGVDDPEERLRALGRAYFRFATTRAARVPDHVRAARVRRRAAPRSYKVKEIRSWQAILQAVELAVQAGVLAGDPDTRRAPDVGRATRAGVAPPGGQARRSAKSAKSLLEPLLDTAVRRHAGRPEPPRKGESDERSRRDLAAITRTCKGAFAPYLHEDETTPLEVSGRDPARAPRHARTATARTRSSRRARAWRTTGSTATG